MAGSRYEDQNGWEFTRVLACLTISLVFESGCGMSSTSHANEDFVPPLDAETATRISCGWLRRVR